MAKNLLLWVVIAVVLMSVFSNFQGQGTTAQEIPYSQFLTEVENSRPAWRHDGRTARHG